MKRRVTGTAMKGRMTLQDLARQNVWFAGTGGRSEGSRGLGFEPAFYDFSRGLVHRSRFADGSPAPMHVLDGLPEDSIARRDATGRVVAAKATIIAGFVRNGSFYTRTAAARAVAEWSSCED